MYETDDLSAEAHHDDAVLRPVPDLAGLQVEDASGIPVGELFGALIEADTGLVRYVDLELSSLDRHVLVPIGHTRLQEEEKQKEARLRLRAALLEDLEQIPPFAADVSHVDDPFERALLEAYGRTFHGERYYAHPSYDHKGVYVGEHPVESDGEAETEEPLMRLSYLPGWRVAKGEADIRGWPVVLDDGEQLEVRDLIVEPAAGKVRYAVVALPGGSGARLLPVGFLRIERAERRVRAAGPTLEDVQQLPVYEGGGVTRGQEDRLNAVLRRRFAGRRRYQLPDFHSDGPITTAEGPQGS